MLVIIPLEGDRQLWPITEAEVWLVSSVVESIGLGSPSKCPMQGWMVTQEGKGQTHGSFSEELEVS